LTRDCDNQSQTQLDGNEVRSQVKCAVRLTDDEGTEAGDNTRLSLNHKCAVRLTDDEGTEAGDNTRLSLNRGLDNWRVNPGRWNQP